MVLAQIITAQSSLATLMLYPWASARPRSKSMWPPQPFVLGCAGWSPSYLGLTLWYVWSKFWCSLLSVEIFIEQPGVLAMILEDVHAALLVLSISSGDVH